MTTIDVDKDYYVVYDPNTKYVAKNIDVNERCKHNWIFKNAGNKIYLTGTRTIISDCRCTIYAPKNLEIVNYKLVKYTTAQLVHQMYDNGTWYSYSGNPIPNKLFRRLL